MNKLKIGNIYAHFSPDEVSVKTDDRQELLKTITYSGGSFVPGVVALDGGYTSTGQVDTYSGVKIKAADWSTFYGYWTGRTACTVIGVDGVTSNSCRIVIKGWRVSKYFSTYIADIEIWRA